MIKVWREIVSIPTYEIGKAEKNPIFLEKRVYQGSSGVVYPYPVVESIANEPTPHDWKVVFLENEYLLVMVMPELGGRIQMAYDKIKKRHFVYYNHVIKPALVGLTGPWISGGIEFNWPQHHRPSTYLPVDSTIVENEDGSVTVWVNEMEQMFHQKGSAGFTLRPGCAYLEIQGVLYNRTDVPQTFLWWANPAVEVNDAYQSVFPPDVNAVFDHGKRAVSSFPIATGTYYKMDYSAGVDISNYRNIKVPTSYMGVNSKYDFEGGYENDTKAGMLHVASHHFSPGKKQWTWGNGDFGRAWDRNLTDRGPAPAPSLIGRGVDSSSAEKVGVQGNCPPPSKGGAGGESLFRPYIELMAGVYTENQPDFTWLMPYEEKRFVQYFMPYRELGVVKQASKDLMLNIEMTAEGARFLVFATSRQEVRIVLANDNGEEYYNQELVLSPESVLDRTVDVKGAKLDELTLTITRNVSRATTSRREGGSVLLWHAEPDEIRPIPDAAEAALSPEDTKTNDQLYLTGLHLEQYRHATWSALDYYEEALRRDPRDVRCLNQMGLWYLRRGRFALAEEYLTKAVKVWQRRNPNPYDGEPLYNLGLALKYQGKLDEAYERFWKATWNKGWADAGYFEAAKISVAQGRLEDALDELERCLQNNWHNHKARALKAAAERKVAASEQSRLAFIEESLGFDHFNYGCLYEKYLLTKDESVLTELKTMLRKSCHNYDELALDYAQAGLREEALDIWKIAESEGAVSPMTYYYIGDYEKAEAASPDYCFPNRPEAILALVAATEKNPKGARAPYYLGCLYYDKRQYDLAIECWERSAELDPQFPTVWRNLALARFNKQDRQEEALELMEKAFALDTTDSRILMELDQLYRRMQKPHQFRLDHLQKYPELIARRDDLVLEEITLLNQLGRYEEAMQKLDAHQFHPWEGGEGKVPAQYQIARVELAKRKLAPLSVEPPSGTVGEGASDAIRLLNECLEYPHHLGEGKLYGAQENDFYYFLGLAYEQKGDMEKARQCWEEATKGPQEPAAAMYYNDAKPDKIFYQGLALRKLGRDGEANGRFYKLVNYGKQHIFEHQTMDYFAVSLPDLLIWEDSLDVKNRIHCCYMLALGYYGLGDKQHAERYLAEVEKLDINHYGTQAFRSLMSM